MASKKGSPRSAAKPNPYQTLVEYYQALPNGWASFPECEARSTLARSLRERAAFVAIDSIPASVEPIRLFEYLESRDEWIPEIAHVALLLAIRDASYSPTERGRNEFLEWITQLNRQIFAKPSVSEHIVGGTPRDVITNMPTIWEMTHRGTPLTILSQAENSATLCLTHPAGLFTELSWEAQRRAIAVALAQAGAIRLKVKLKTEVVDGMAQTVLDATWR